MFLNASFQEMTPFRKHSIQSKLDNSKLDTELSPNKEYDDIKYIETDNTPLIRKSQPTFGKEVSSISREEMQEPQISEVKKYSDPVHEMVSEVRETELPFGEDVGQKVVQIYSLSKDSSDDQGPPSQLHSHRMNGSIERPHKSQSFTEKNRGRDTSR